MLARLTEDAFTAAGYWNLENSDKEWTPPKSLENFMEKARDDGKPLVYIVRKRSTQGSHGPHLTGKCLTVCLVTLRGLDRLLCRIRTS
jgi:hypothetical protein